MKIVSVILGSKRFLIFFDAAPPCSSSSRQQGRCSRSSRRSPAPGPLRETTTSHQTTAAAEHQYKYYNTSCSSNLHGKMVAGTIRSLKPDRLRASLDSLRNHANFRQLTLFSLTSLLELLEDIEVYQLAAYTDFFLEDDGVGTLRSVLEKHSTDEDIKLLVISIFNVLVIDDITAETVSDELQFLVDAVSSNASGAANEKLSKLICSVCGNYFPFLLYLS